ncbi:MAG: sigma-70 family RNA polymerase sigma factor [Candidatus Dojkabacteria bacterium]
MKQSAQTKHNLKDSRKLFEKLYSLLKNDVYWYIYKKVNNQELAEDIASDVFMKLFDHPEIMHERDSNGVKAWLFTVGRNAMIDHFRKSANSTSKRQELDDEIFEIVSKEEGHYLEDEILEDEIDILTASMDILSPAEKELIHLRFREEMSFNEIAEILDKKEGAVKMMVYRALEKLKQHIGDRI